MFGIVIDNDVSSSLDPDDDQRKTELNESIDENDVKIKIQKEQRFHFIGN